MIPTFVCGLAAVSLLALPLSASATPASADATPALVAPMTLAEGISLLPVAEEVRKGYKRTSLQAVTWTPTARWWR
ncbi:hypothetical protein ACIRQP_32000 [Streptomyces sp. NPDC102274]|uniref:hypothetical protein n=1 Tax=Streptomyces sp. NPDC102274 TaxID=3366151 RepID=UPI0037F4A95B